jgi:hypothetical protein
MTGSQFCAGPVDQGVRSRTQKYSRELHGAFRVVRREMGLAGELIVFVHVTIVSASTELYWTSFIRPSRKKSWNRKPSEGLQRIAVLALAKYSKVQDLQTRSAVWLPMLKDGKISSSPVNIMLDNKASSAAVLVWGIQGKPIILVAQ